ncbi:MAG: hypothetical protein P4L50_19540 [Anaerolineaceae bacterium]|nr:hypothetical protein [Anaerolineaceae bacterium]
MARRARRKPGVAQTENRRELITPLLGVITVLLILSKDRLP